MLNKKCSNSTDDNSSSSGVTSAKLILIPSLSDGEQGIIFPFTFLKCVALIPILKGSYAASLTSISISAPEYPSNSLEIAQISSFYKQ